MNRLHIAMFTNVYRPLANGVVTSVSSFRRGLIKRGHIVCVMAPHTAEDHLDEERFVFRYPAVELPLQRYPLTLPVSPFVDHLLPHIQLDLIHAHHPMMLGRVAARKSRRLKVPLIFTYHTRYHEYSHYVKGVPDELVKEILETWLAHFMRDCHHVIVPSESIRTLLNEIYGIRERVSVLPTGVELSRFAKNSREEARRELDWSMEPLTIVSVGRLAKEKNWELLLRATQSAIKDHPSLLRLVIIGGGEEKDHLMDFSQRLGILEKVDFIGSIPPEKIPLYLAASDIFCFASTTETQGLATLEAMAAGLPVVAVEASGTSDVVTNGVEGFLTAKDHLALGSRLKDLASDSNLRRRLGESGRRRATAFSEDRQAARLEEIYNLTLQDYRGGYRGPDMPTGSQTALGRFLTHFRRHG